MGLRGSGTGVPFHFRCSACRKNPAIPRGPMQGSVSHVELTGAAKTAARSSARRMADTSYQYRCLDCGHVGWSAHMDLARAAVARGMTR